MENNLQKKFEIQKAISLVESPWGERDTSKIETEVMVNIQ